MYVKTFIDISKYRWTDLSLRLQIRITLKKKWFCNTEAFPHIKFTLYDISGFDLLTYVIYETKTAMSRVTWTTNIVVLLCF